MELAARVELLRASLEEPLLVTGSHNLAYLTGFRSSNAAALVEPGRVRLFADFRYAEAARAVEGVEFVETARSLLADLAQRLEGRIGFEADHVAYAGWETLAAGGLELVPRRGLVEALRAVKDEDELALIRRAAAITSEAYARLAGEGIVGRTEREASRRLEQLFFEGGADAVAFPAIVASGPSGARPHATPTDTRIGRRQAVVIDAGCAVGGYCSDCTRTFATGPLPGELREAYAACLRGQLAGLEAVRPGATGVDADRAARDVIAAAGYGERFGHGLGHGLGLEVHEAPTLSTLSRDTLVAGNVVTVEPGIYLEGLGGIRIEDLVVVGEDGNEVLTTFTKDLLEVE